MATTKKKEVSEMKLRFVGPASEIDETFLQTMVNQMMFNFNEYGPVAEADTVDNMASAWQRMAKYHQTGNTKYLVDAANFLMMEFRRMGPEAFNGNADPIGRVRTNGQVDYAPN